MPTLIRVILAVAAGIFVSILVASITNGLVGVLAGAATAGLFSPLIRQWQRK